MRIAKIIGTVTLSRWHPSLAGGRYRLAVPLSLDNLTGEKPPSAEPLVVYDELNAGRDSLIAFSEGAEAAQPFRPEIKPIDAYNAAILDAIHLEPTAKE
jgi:ethanolamine utilization protein EutN